VVHKSNPSTQSIPPLDTASHKNDAVVLPSLLQITESVGDISLDTPLLALAAKQAGDGPPQKSLPSLENEKSTFDAIKPSGGWTPATILANFMEMEDESTRERFWLYIRERSSYRSLPIITIHYLLRSSVPEVAAVLHTFAVHLSLTFYRFNGHVAIKLSTKTRRLS
jgi:hypothetical protein